MSEISVARRRWLRAGYVFLAGGLAFAVWPELLHHDTAWPLQRGIVVSMLAALSLLSGLGAFYPLQMIPVLVFELTWKAIWLLAVAAPAWVGHRLDAKTTETAIECLVACVFLPLIPWRRLGDRFLPGSRATFSSGAPSALTGSVASKDV